ncbi:MAG TPA: fluoride efflux transporter CrcB [Bdellovibrionota bacterium]|nr:fluoride efflux transporter CrcB [Bdellovibrionota bacterium]
MRILAIALMGTAGVLARYGLYLWIPKVLAPPFPYPTLIINGVGAFLIGLLFGWDGGRWVISDGLRLGLGVGFLGGFTTFSSFCLETVRLVEMGQTGLAVSYAVLSNVLGMAACFGGIALSK